MLAAIGDVHGCKTELLSLIKKLLKIKDLHTIVMLGDYVDRGPDSKGVLDILINWKYTPKLICLRGNHDDFMINGVLHNDQNAMATWLHNGGVEAKKSFKNMKEIKKYCEWMEKHLIIKYKVGKLFFVHAGIDPKMALSKQDPHNMIWTRSKEFFTANKFPGNVTVIHGHTPIKKPEMTHNRIAIDTGCVFGYNLTSALFDDLGNFVTFISVNSKQL